jgi:sterol desaturase/sphingolipid hydroxylase (fatty acid hydroxylase superfamily)
MIEALALSLHFWNDDGSRSVLEHSRAQKASPSHTRFCRVSFASSLFLKSAKIEAGQKYFQHSKKGSSKQQMNKQALFYGSIALVVLGILLGVYYLIPGLYHPAPIYLTHRGHAPYAVHRLYAAGFFVLAVVGGAIAFVMRPKVAGA